MKNKILALDIATNTGWKTGQKSTTTPKGVFVHGIDMSKRQPDRKFYYVFCSVNFKTGSLYIGKRTSDTVLDSYIGSGTALKDAVKKYGYSSFGKHILEYSTDKNSLHELELYYIDLFNAHNNEACYNLIRDSSKPLKGRAMSEETKERLRIIFTGKKMSEETKKLISIASKMRRHTDETKNKISLNAKGRVISQKQRNDIRNTLTKRWNENKSYREYIVSQIRKNLKKVYQYDKEGVLIKEHYCIADAIRDTGYKNIYSIFNNKRIYGYGYYWSYEKIENILEIVKSHDKIRNFRNTTI